jgi:AcrR family transcriptional regulator
MSPPRSANRNRRKKILDSARVLFWKKGYPGTSMVHLANACECKPANIYNYFKSKEEILFEVLREEMEKIVAPVDHLEDDNSHPPLDQLLFFIRNHVNVTLSYRRSAKMLFDIELGHLSPDKREVIIDMRRKYDRILCNIIERGIEAGVFAPGNTKLAAYSIASIIARSRVWYSPRGSLTPNQIGEFIFEFVVSGLRAAGLKHRNPRGEEVLSLLGR